MDNPSAPHQSADPVRFNKPEELFQHLAERLNHGLEAKGRRPVGPITQEELIDALDP